MCKGKPNYVWYETYGIKWHKSMGLFWSHAWNDRKNNRGWRGVCSEWEIENKHHSDKNGFEMSVLMNKNVKLIICILWLSLWNNRWKIWSERCRESLWGAQEKHNCEGCWLGRWWVFTMNSPWFSSLFETHDRKRTRGSRSNNNQWNDDDKYLTDKFECERWGFLWVYHSWNWNTGFMKVFLQMGKLEFQVWKH